MSHALVARQRVEPASSCGALLRRRTPEVTRLSFDCGQMSSMLRFHDRTSRPGVTEADSDPGVLMRHDDTFPDGPDDDVTREFWGSTRGWLSSDVQGGDDLAGRTRSGDDTTGTLRVIRDGFAAFRPQVEEPGRLAFRLMSYEGKDGPGRPGNEARPEQRSAGGVVHGNPVHRFALERRCNSAGRYDRSADRHGSRAASNLVDRRYADSLQRRDCGGGRAVV